MGIAPVTAFLEVAKLRGSKNPMKYNTDLDFVRGVNELKFPIEINNIRHEYALSKLTSASQIEEKNSTTFVQKVVEFLSKLFKN